MKRATRTDAISSVSRIGQRTLGWVVNLRSRRTSSLIGRKLDYAFRISGIEREKKIEEGWIPGQKRVTVHSDKLGWRSNSNLFLLLRSMLRA